MIRREVLQGLGALALWTGMARAAAGVPFSEEMLDALAREVAARPYAPRPLVPLWGQHVSLQVQKCACVVLVQDHGNVCWSVHRGRARTCARGCRRARGVAPGA